MNEQANHEAILSKTLRVLVQQHQLTPAELAQIRLSDLHLAGKSPTINFTPAGSHEPKTVQLDLDTHRALVNWLVNRPDAVSDFLFPGSGDEAMSQADLQRLLEQAGATPAAAEPSPLPFPPAPPEAEEGLPPLPPTASRPLRPVSRPEMGAPPPASFQPPPTPPEAESETPGFMPKTAPPLASGPGNPSRPVAVPPAPPEVAPVPLSQAQSAPEGVADATMISAKKPEAPEAKQGGTKAAAAAPSKPVAKTAASPAKQASRPVQPAMAARAAKSPALTQRPAWARFVVPGGIVAVLLLCGICLAGGWYTGGFGPAGDLLAGWGLSGAPAGDNQTATEAATTAAAVAESPLPTPTLPATSTPTALPPTDTPAPTDTSTSTPAPTNTPTVLPTDTPESTATPTPTDTPEPEQTEEPEAAAAPTEEPAAPSTKYPAPELLEPLPNFAYIQGNTIVLKWKPVDLAPNEHYAVRLVYPYQGQPTYRIKRQRVGVDGAAVPLWAN
ncbi:MAG: hypothetical protein U0401_11785 [Anaerolineae bacterium]